MFSDMLTFLYFIPVGAVCIGWAALWIKTFRRRSVRALILHTLIFSVLSALILFTALHIVFSGVDDSCSASNKGALGFLYMSLLVPFLCACIIAFFQTVGDFITRTNDCNDNKEDQSPTSGS